MSRVFVVGDWILDKTTYVSVRGVSPESENVLVLQTKGQEAYNLGGAANVAANVKSLGGDVLAVGCFGSDPEARKIEHLFDAAGIQYYCWTFAGRTTLKHRICTSSGQYVRIDTEDVEAAKTDTIQSWEASLPVTVLAGIKTDSVVCLVDYDKGCCTQNVVFDIVNACHRVGCPLLVDPGRTGDWERYGSRRTIFKVNLRQAQTFCTKLRHPYKVALDPHEVYDGSVYEGLVHHVNRLAKRANVHFSHLWITLGAGGMVYAPPDAAATLIPHHAPLQVADVCGAGDTAMAVLAFHLARAGFGDTQLLEGIRLANGAAGVAVQKKGVYVAKPADLIWELAREH